MRSRFLNVILPLLISGFLFSSCRHDEGEADLVAQSGYPDAVASIIINKCATSGCHDDKSKAAAAGLSLQTWSRMFEGSNGGAVVIPYRPDHSTLIYYVNHDSLLSYLQLSPTMPVNRSPLTLGELETLRDWIIAGAPDKNGFIKFSDNAARKKFYVTNQGCDVVTVFDCASGLAMRVADVGNSPVIESPHMIRVAPNNEFWYVCYINGSVFQKFSTYDNTLYDEANIGLGSWNTFCISSDNQKAYVVDFALSRIAVIDLNLMTTTFFNVPGNPHGSTLNETNDTLYITAQLASYLLKIPVNDLVNFEQVDLVGQFPTSGVECEPHDVALMPDGLTYLVTCQESNDVRFLLRSNDSVIAAIPVGLYPQEISFSTTHPYAFVTCMDALNADPNKRGSVAVINYQTRTLVKTIYSGYQPHGLIVDDTYNKVYVGNRNTGTQGPPPHHSSLCAGKNGYISVIDMNTLELIPGSNTEVSVDPYGLGISH